MSTGLAYLGYLPPHSQLAEKLELALAERSREVYNLRFQLQDRRHRQHKLRSGQHWFSEEGMSVSMGSLAETENVAESGGTSTILPRQSSEELTQLPSLLTNKVLELKEGLNYLCNASGMLLKINISVLVSDQQKPKEYSPEATTTFVLKFGKRDESSADARGDPPAVVQVDSEGNTSPVTCVTITPAFWKKRDRSGEEDTTQDDGWGTPDLKADDTSPINRDSFCSAVSSASATSSVCDDDEDEKDADSYVSEMDNQDAQTSARAVGSDESANKRGDVSEASMNESDHDRSSDDEDGEDGDEDEDEEHSKIRSRDHEQEALLKNRGQNEQDSSQEYNYKSLFGEPYPGYYETEVYTSKGVGRQRKILKTRRVSDTHVGYKHQKDSQEEVAKTESSNSDYDSGNGKSVSDSASVETCRLEPTYSSQTPLNKSEEHETVSNRDLDDEQNQRECKSEADDKYTSESVLMGFRMGYPQAMDRRPGSGSNKASNCPQNISDSSSTHTPDNVFVKTTRKIFSPVRRDSKGKASSVVSYIVGETSPTSSIDRTRLQHEQSVAITSPIINVVRREQSNENSSVVLSKPKNGSSNMPTPAWMITKSRSQSSSPALTRRKGSSSVEKSSSSSDTNSLSSVQNKSTEGTFHSEANTIRTPNMEHSVENIMPPKSILKDEHIDPKKKDVEAESGLLIESSIENSKTEKCDKSSFPASPSSSFPPLPQSPNPNRRDLFKVSTKETAPSIRMMIAKYNQKLTEQQEGAGGRSPEVGGSGSASPVAWRSPVAERRVRAQMEKYQEEVQRVLQQGGKRSAMRFCGSKLQKSVSDGVIRAPESPPVVTSESKDSEDIVTKKNLSLSAQPRSILKSPSAGSIKPTSSLPLTPISSPVLQPVLVESSSDTPTRLSPTKPPSPRLNTSPNPTTPSSPELGIHHSSPPPSRLRALRLQRAKEEFLTRGPGGQSWTSETGTPSTDTPSASVSPEPFWGREATSEPDRDTVRPVLRIKEASSANRSRLSQISVESESSYDSSLMLPGFSRKNPRDVSDEGMLLVKSASAGMINVDPHTYRKFYADRGAGEPQPSTSDSQEGKQKTQSCSKFGISSITSRFRRVKMRKNKDREGGKMNAVSALCRQSLLVDLHLTKGSTSSGGAEAPGPSTSKSCPSSPVLQRSSSGEKSGSGTSSAPTSWILNPARKIFKPK
ncbi:hypothetical protein ANN_16380 [Periplaneta americana]|uniref:Uncharacterized protein n=1 Tax=Periplaneta americana TaxID=6978 RepID=A0ABQ8SK26_PERAM|nr:hypothetical protein ANN_16380 [Periplaneta americana]